ncbi:MAG: DUF1501 domain-containing protein [Pirellulaceae bacterium]|nr:DUF1501 domain-containing protein [Pirellulaceae bacterium]
MWRATATRKCSDGLTRRDLLKVGGIGVGGLSLAGYLRLAEAGQLRPGGQARSGILIYLNGGPTHLDTFDLKPDAPSEVRGEFNPIDTNVPGVRICEHLPKLAACADKYTILRGVSHALAAHEFGRAYLTTGNAPLASLRFPGYGSVISKELPGEPDLPAYVAVPRTPEVSGYLGVQYTALSTGAAPRPNQPFSVRGISLRQDVTTEVVNRRQSLLGQLDGSFGEYARQDDLLSGLDRFSAKALEIITSPRSRRAFDISQEPSEVAARFGEHAFGQSCLLATRLIESGVRFVTVDYGGWDTHRDNFGILKTTKLPELDSGLAGLFTTLAERGLLEETAVMVCGEFGRTPKINANAGRDHWPRAMFVLLAGGGIAGGRVLGASSEKGETPAEGDGYSPDDVAASFYHAFGIDHTHEYHEATGRPIMIVRHGEVIRELFA